MGTYSKCSGIVCCCKTDEVDRRRFCWSRAEPAAYFGVVNIAEPDDIVVDDDADDDDDALDTAAFRQFLVTCIVSDLISGLLLSFKVEGYCVCLLAKNEKRSIIY